MLPKCIPSWVAAVAVLVAVILAPAVQAADPIRIGSLLAVTGPAAFQGDPQLKTIRLYIDRINANGGVLGRPLELIHYDDGGRAQAARTFAKRLIQNDEVDIILGGTTTGTTLAVIPLVNQAEVPFISLASGTGIIEPVKRWVFKTPPTAPMAARRIFQDMHARGLSKIGLISGTGGFGKSGRKLCQQVAGEFGIEIVANETYAPEDTDMTAQLTQIKNTDGVQAVLNFGFGRGAARVTKDYRRLGMDLPLYQSHGAASKGLLAWAGEAAEGVRLPAAALLVADQLPDGDPQKTVVTHYRDAYQAKYDSAISTFGGHAYDGLMIAVDAMQRAGSADPAAVREAIENTRGFIGTGGVVNLSADDHLGLGLDALRMLEVRDGDWVLVD